jgi:hypothetical protein
MRSLTLSLFLATVLVPVAGCTTYETYPPMAAYQPKPVVKKAQVRKTPVRKKTQVASTAPKRVSPPPPEIISPILGGGGGGGSNDGGGGPGGGWN